LSEQPSISSLIGFSWLKAKEILFPFNFKRWLKILLIVWLAGQAANGLGGGGNYSMPEQALPAGETEEGEQATQPTVATQQSVPQTQRNDLDDTTGIPQGFPGAQSLGAATETEEDGLPPLPTGLMIALIPVFLILALTLAWLSARFNFLLLEFMVTRDILFKKSFQAHRAEGNSYFRWLLCFIGLSFLALVLFIVPSFFIKPLIWLSLVLVLLLGLSASVISILVVDFVLPIMYQDKISCMEACRKLLGQKPNASSLLLYLVVKIGLGILSGIVVMVIGVAVAVIIFVVGLVLGAGANALSDAIPILQSILPAVSAIFILFGIGVALVVIGLLTLPIPIFFRAFALSYLTRIDPSYNLLGFSQFDSPESA